MIWVAAIIGGLIGAAAGVLGVQVHERRKPRPKAVEDADPCKAADLRRETLTPVTIRARRDIPLDVWMDRIERTDAKTASVQLQLSMAQQIATEAAQHVQVTYCYDPVKKIYEISARMRVVPWRDWE